MNHRSFMRQFAAARREVALLRKRYPESARWAELRLPRSVEAEKKGKQ